MKWLACILMLVPTAFAEGPTANRIDALIKASPAASQAFWGIRVMDLTNGSIVLSKNENHFFVPASNTKLFSTAIALRRRGPDYRLETTVTAGSPADAKGVIHGDLRLVGGGDPNLSARVLPYKQDEFTDNPLQAVEELADQLARR